MYTVWYEKSVRDDFFSEHVMKNCEENPRRSVIKVRFNISYVATSRGCFVINEIKNWDFFYENKYELIFWAHSIIYYVL